MKQWKVAILSALSLGILTVPVKATVLEPDAYFSFALSMYERDEIIELVSVALVPQQFGRADVSNRRPNGFFRARYTSESNNEVSLAGRPSGVGFPR